MNRQTLAVALGTLALVVIGAVLLYATPGPEATRTPKPAPAGGAVEEAVAEAGDGKEKAKGPHRLGDAKLVHATEVPADRPAAPEGSPNVVVIVASTQRRDQWTVYGGAENVTPYLASVAKTGVRMMDGLTVAVSPRDADAAIVTGLYPHRTGVVEPADKKNFRKMKDDVNTLAERFQSSGWLTIGATGNHHLNVKAGTAQGFDWYRDSQPFSLMIEQRVSADTVVTKALERVAARTDAEKTRPVYLQLAFVDSHKPFKVSPEQSKPFEVEGKDLPAPYLATIRAQDDAVKKLAEGLAAQGITAENTVFVVVGDHGEGLELPVHHRKQHGFVLYRSSVQVPWIWWGKGLPAGREVGDLASTIDLAPTVLSLAGIKKLDGFDGLDLSPALLGTTEATGRKLAYADTLYEGANRASIWTTTAQCQNDYGSQIAEPDQFVKACFDRVMDPDFTTLKENPELAAELEKLHTELAKAIDG